MSGQRANMSDMLAMLQVHPGDEHVPSRSMHLQAVSARGSRNGRSNCISDLNGGSLGAACRGWWCRGRAAWRCLSGQLALCLGAPDLPLLLRHLRGLVLLDDAAAEGPDPPVLHWHRLGGVLVHILLNILSWVALRGLRAEGEQREEDKWQSTDRNAQKHERQRHIVTHAVPTRVARNEKCPQGSAYWQQSTERTEETR